jgi:hypothetical protein
VDCGVLMDNVMFVLVKPVNLDVNVRLPVNVLEMVNGEWFEWRYVLCALAQSKSFFFSR